MTPPDPATTNPKQGSEIFRPYARLISILGDQLITNKWVGVIELVKNCYDADAENVSVRFLNFDEEALGQSPVIEIEDDGDGMTLDTILNVWMKPATPNKLNKKKSNDQRFTKKGRLMQGDKGVGRFAVYKLGNYVEVFTKTKNTPEVRLELNFREYAQDDEFADKTKVPERFLDQVTNDWEINDTPVEIKNNKEKGTLIRISDFRNNWKYEDLKKLAMAFSRMIPPVIPNLKGEPVKDFSVKLFWNETEYKTRILDFETIMNLAPFSFQGSIDIKGNLLYEYKHNKKEIFEEINLFDIDDAKKHDIWNLKLFKEQFLEENNSKSILVKKNGNKISPKNKWKVSRMPNIGDFSFFFFAFDWKNKSDLDQEQEAFIKDNSVYLYRDFTRVYPYGEKGIDWLMLSKLRAEDRAGMYFSYNDLIGFVFISQRYNPKLRDAANREGLVNIDGAYDDFVTLIQAALKVMKDHVTIDKRRNEIEKEKAFTTANQKFATAFDELKKELVKIENEKVLFKAQKLFTATNQLVEQYKERLTIAQELAGVGMAVEKSSHDLSLLIRKIIQNATDIITRFSKGKLSTPDLKNFVEDLIKNLEFLYEEIQILQPLFRVARKVTKDISVKETVERVQRYFRRELLNNINFKIEGSADVLVKTNTGLMLQVFINLIDNAVYWLNQKSSGKREIIVKIDSSTNSVIFADSGFGISDEHAELVFLEFYSMKADGRGLGLYIVKELLDRIDAKISLITQDHLKILPGANFLIQFNEVN